MLFVLLLLAADPQALLQQGLIALQHGQLAEARSTLEEASRVDAANPYVWTSLAQTYLRLGDSQKAESSAVKAGKLGAANPVVAHALSLFYFEYAQQLFRKEDFTHAADILSTGLQADPRNAQLVLALGVARYGQRRFEDAIAQFLQVIGIDPTIEQPYVFLGRVLDQAGPHLPEITKDYESWTEKNPQNAKAPLLLAKALLAADAHDPTAEDLLRRSMTLDPNNWEPHYELGVLLAGKREYRAAAEELTRSIELDPKQAVTHYHLARVYDRLGEPERAKAEREIHGRLTGTATAPAPPAHN
ncbi:MAG TPA: tetratricopeptide repeat protein [Bryobacteraceae bacterium]